MRWGQLPIHHRENARYGVTLSVISVADLLRDTFPAGSVVLGGGAALERPVGWAISLRLTTGFGEIEPGAMALINVDTLRLMPARPTVAQALDSLARVGAVAVALRGRMEAYQVPVTRMVAERVNCVLVQLPDGREGAVGGLEARINGYLSERRREPLPDSRSGGGGQLDRGA